MSSRSKPPSRRTPTLVLALFALALLLAGCGKKGAPMPPPSKLPQPVKDVKVERWGDTVRLEFTYPTVTVGGLPLSGVKAVEVWEVVRPFVAQPVAAPVTTTTPESPPSAGAETGTATSGEEKSTGESAEQGSPSSTAASAPEPTEGAEPSAAGEATTEGTTSTQSTSSSQTSSSEQAAASEQTPTTEPAETASPTGATSPSGTAGTAGTTTTEGTTAPPTVAPPQPTISSLDFKSSAKQLTTIEGDQLKSAILGGKILLEIPASSLHTLPPPPPSEEGEGATAPASTESTAPSESEAPGGAETTTPETAEPSAPPAPEGTGEGAASEQPPAATGEQTPTSTTEPSTTTTQTPPAGESTTATTEMPKPTLEEVHFLAVRTISQDGKTSDFSNTAYLIAGTPPPSPTGLTATTSEDGVQLAWTLPTLPEGSKLEGVQVYRRSQDESVFETPLTTLAADATEYTDASAQFGQQYTYAVGAVGRTRPLIQSALSDTASLLYEDIYQPAAPARLDLFPEAQRVRLIWEASTSPDVVGYRVERAGADGRFDILTSVILTTPEYIDHDVEHGATYSYRIVALDDAGNASEPSPTETTQIP